jgi:tRNA dimethylallyltransferase
MTEGSHQTDYADGIPPLGPSCWFLTGPTASGKTRVGVELAGLLDAEIISLDSMSLYRDMNIATAKPSPEDRERVPHHLLDLVDPTEEFSLAEYLQVAHQAAGRIQDAGRSILFVGGTPLYLKGLLHGISQGPPADWDFREQVRQEVEQLGEQQGNTLLHERLAQVDPLSAHKLHPNDLRRIIRALEVYKITGQPISHSQVHFEDQVSAGRHKVLALAWPRQRLHQRIEARVDQMFVDGLEDEVRGLLDRYGQLSRTASQAVGYRELIALLQEQVPWDETVEQVKRRTRQFARRQETWFRSLEECQQVEQSDEVEAAVMARQLLEME